MSHRKRKIDNPLLDAIHESGSIYENELLSCTNLSYELIGLISSFIQPICPQVLNAIKQNKHIWICLHTRENLVLSRTFRQYIDMKHVFHYSPLLKLTTDIMWVIKPECEKINPKEYHQDNFFTFRDVGYQLLHGSRSNARDLFGQPNIRWIISSHFLPPAFHKQEDWVVVT